MAAVALDLFAPVASSPRECPRIGCLYIPDFRLQVHLVQLGEDPDGGLALVDPEDGRRLIVAASANARLDGVKRGMPAVTAAALAPELCVREIDHVALAETHAALEESVRAVTPSFETTGAGVLYAAYNGLERRYAEDGERAFLDDLKDAALRLGLPARVGCASTRFAARAAAVLQGRLRGGPAACCVPAGTEADFLAPLPLQLLPEAIDLIDQLGKLGIFTLGDFAALPADGVARRWSSRGTALHRLARGEDRGTLVPAPEPRRFFVQVHAEYPVVQAEALRFLIRRPLERLIGDLDGEGLAARALAWTLKLDGADPLSGRTCSAAPSASLRLWTDLLKVGFERLTLPGGVLSVSMEAEGVGPRPAAQERLIGPRSAPPGALSITLAHLAAEVGPDAFGRLAPRPATWPEDRQVLAPPRSDPAARPRKPPPRPELPVPDATPRGALTLAFRRVDPPRPLEMELLPDGRLRGFRHPAFGFFRIDRLRGPWDVSTGWWEGERRRRYFQLEGPQGIAHVYVEPGSGWSLVGWLD